MITQLKQLKYAKFAPNTMAVEEMKDKLAQHIAAIAGYDDCYKVDFHAFDTPAFLIVEGNNSRGIHFCEANEKGLSCIHATALAAIAAKLGKPLIKVNVKSSLTDIEEFNAGFDSLLPNFKNMNTSFSLLEFFEDEEETNTVSTVSTNNSASPVTPAVPVTTRDWKKGWKEIQKHLVDQGVQVGLINKIQERRERISNTVPFQPHQLPPEKPHFPYVGEYLERALMHIMMGKHLILIGDMGSGKDTLSNTIAWIFNLPSIIHGATGSDTKESIVGEPGFHNNESTFDFGPFTKTVEQGGLANLAEVNMLSGDVTALFHSLMDENEVLSTPVGAVKAHEDFICVATLNVGGGYSGTKKLNKAFKDRFAVLRLPQGLNFKDLISTKTGLVDSTALTFLEQVKESLEELFMDRRGMDAKTFRGFIDAAKLFVEFGYSHHTKLIACEDYIINKEEDSEDYFELRANIRNVFPAFPITEEEQLYLDSLTSQSI